MWSCEPTDDGHHYASASIAISANPRRVLWARHGPNSLHSVDIDSGEIAWFYQERGHTCPTGRFFAVAASPRSTLIALARREFVLLLDGESGKVIDRLTPPRPPRCLRESRLVEFSPCGRILALGELFDVCPFDVVDVPRRPVGHRLAIELHSDLAFCPDRPVFVASSSVDRIAWIWNYQNGTIEETLRENERLNTVAWSPKDDLIASGSDQGTVRLYSARYSPLPLVKRVLR